MAKKKLFVQSEIEPVKLITGFIYSSKDAYVSALEELENRFGPVQFESETFPFDYTSYYCDEMGDHLMRSFVSFENPVSPDSLRESKLATNEMERRYLNENDGRLVNIDPGLVGLANLVLASTKAYTHRVYLGDGIYAEVTLLYENKAFMPLPWTYPDYRRDDILQFLLRVRENLKEYIAAKRQNKL